MSRDNGGTHKETRSSALWGTGNRGGDSRANALWGKGGRSLGAILTVLFVTAIPFAGASGSGKHAQTASYLDPALEAKARLTPNAYVDVIIQSDRAAKAEDAFEDVDNPGSSKNKGRLNHKFKFVGSVAVTIKAKKILASELMYAKGMDEDEASVWLDGVLAEVGPNGKAKVKAGATA